MKNLTWQNPEQLFVAQELINKVKSKCCGIKVQKDPDDNKFVDCAITAGARYIVTEDHHYDVIKWKDFPGLDVVGLDEFLKHLLKINL